MATPPFRTKVVVARGTHANLVASLADLAEGELCFATDNENFYVKSGGVLVNIVSSGGGGGAVDSVNGQTGDVVLAVSDLSNDANYITSAEAPVQPGDLFSGDYNDLTNQPTIPPAYDDTTLAGRVTTNEGDISQLQTDVSNINSFSGDYDDLTNKPSIPANTSDLNNDSGYITAAEAPVQPGDVFSGDYDDLTNKPTIPAAAPVDSVNGQTGAVTLEASDVGAATAAQGALADSAIQSGDLAAVATSGDYGDLINAPSIPAAPGDIGAATAAQGALADSAIQPGTVNPVFFANQAAFPDATANHGAVAHSHADGAMYFAHAGVWIKMANDSDLPTNVSQLANDSGYLTTETVNNIDLSALPTLP